jgi:hypothetical protein
VNANVVGGFGRYVLSHEVGADGQLAMAAVDQDGQTDGPGTAVVDERVHRGTDGASGEEHVVNEHDDLVIDGEVEGGLVNDRRVADPREIVSVQRDVEGAKGDGRTLVRADRVSQARRQDVAARANTDDGEPGDVAVAFDDLVCDPRYSATNVVGAEQRGQA